MPIIEETGAVEQELKINEGEYFIMGDDVNNALDSRHFGVIQEELTQETFYQVFISMHRF